MEDTASNLAHEGQPTHHYTVSLRGAPEIFSARRAALEQQFRAALNAQFPDGEAGVWDCLHADQDAVEDENIRPYWAEAVAVALAALDAVLPPGGRFECELLWPESSGYVGDRDEDGV